MPIPTPPSPKTHLTCRVPLIVWAGFTGIRGGQRITTKDFDNFLYRLHSATITTPSCCESSACWGERQQSTSDGGDGQRNGNMTATVINGAKAMQRQCDCRSSGTATAGSVAVASAAQGWQWQRGGGPCGASCSTAAMGSRVAEPLRNHSSPFSSWKQRALG
jgi:hypothetical protein